MTEVHLAYHRAVLEEQAAGLAWRAIQFEYMARHEAWRAAQTRRDIAFRAYVVEEQAQQDAYAASCREKAGRS